MLRVCTCYRINAQNWKSLGQSVRAADSHCQTPSTGQRAPLLAVPENSVSLQLCQRGSDLSPTGENVVSFFILYFLQKAVSYLTPLDCGRPSSLSQAHRYISLDLSAQGPYLSHGDAKQLVQHLDPRSCLVTGHPGRCFSLEDITKAFERFSKGALGFTVQALGKTGPVASSTLSFSLVIRVAT